MMKQGQLGFLRVKTKYPRHYLPVVVLNLYWFEGLVILVNR